MLFNFWNIYYLIFFIIIISIILLLRPPSYFLLAVSICLIVISTPAINTLEKLTQSNTNLFLQPKSSVNKLFKPESGEEVLPDIVQDMIFLLRSNRLNNYQTSASYKDGALVQRLVEGAWPARYEMASQYLLISPNEEKSYSSCLVLSQREEVILVHCP
jgi:hypothetical protein